MKSLASLLLAGLILVSPARAMNEQNENRIVSVIEIYDGDTFKFNMPGLWDELNPVSVRILGIDTPEIKGNCQKEKDRASMAKAQLGRLFLLAGRKAILTDIEWDKYGGRILAHVYVQVNGEYIDVANFMTKMGLATPYFGKGEKTNWCKD